MIKILNKIWTAIIFCSLVFSFIKGTAGKLTESVLETGGECVSLMLTLLAGMSFFNGLMKAADSAGITSRIAKILSRPLRKLFPEIPGDHKVFSQMSMNISANMLGMGNAATPPGISAMRSLSELNGNSREASRAMCLFAVMNTSSVQLIPTTVAALRMNYGSASPFAVTVPVIISSFIGLFTGIAAVNFHERRSKRNEYYASGLVARYSPASHNGHNGSVKKKGGRVFCFFSRRKGKS